MSIIWCGGEPIDFRKNTVGEVETYHSNYRTDFARCALRSLNSIVYYSNIFTPVNVSVWMHCQFKHGSSTASDVNSFPFGIRNSVTGDTLGVGFAADDKWSIGKRTADGTVTWFVSEAVSSLNDQMCSLDVHIENYGVSGAIHFYRNGSLVLTYSGDITVGSTTEFDQIRLYRVHDMFATDFSEIIVADEDTRLMSLKTLVPNAAGDASQWDGTYANVDENGINDSDTVYTDVVEEDMQFNLTGMPAGNFICKSVKTIARATDGVGGIGMQMGIKTNDTLHLSNTITLGGTWDQYENMYNQNPETLNRFTPAEIEALQLAFRSKSTA